MYRSSQHFEHERYHRFGHASSMYRSSPFRSTLNTNVITGLDMCQVCTEAVHSVASHMCASTRNVIIPKLTTPQRKKTVYFSTSLTATGAKATHLKIYLLLRLDAGYPESPRQRYFDVLSQSIVEIVKVRWLGFLHKK